MSLCAKQSVSSGVKKKELKEPGSQTNHVDIDKTGNVHVDHSDKARNEHGDPNHIAQKKPIDPLITDKEPEHVKQGQAKSLFDQIGSALAGLFRPKPTKDKEHSQELVDVTPAQLKENGKDAKDPKKK